MSEKDTWKSLLLNLLTSNISMVVVWTIQTSFGYQPNYWMSLIIVNAWAVLWWLFKVINWD